MLACSEGSTATSLPLWVVKLARDSAANEVVDEVTKTPSGRLPER